MSHIVSFFCGAGNFFEMGSGEARNHNELVGVDVLDDPFVLI